MTEQVERLSNAFVPYMEDFNLCQEVIKKHSKSFYRAFSQLPEQQALSIFAIYAFCREADDTIDEYQDIHRLYQLKIELKRFLAGDIPDRYFWRALVPIFETYQMNEQAFHDMLEGQEKDYSFQQPTTDSELERYCYYVAGTVGLMLLPILSEQATMLSEQAIKLGQAMQLTNILRDIGEDLRMDRIYLAKNRMQVFHVTKDQLNNQIIDEAFINLWEYYAQKAEQLYEEALTIIPLVHEECREAFLLAILFYREILTAVRKNHYRCFDQKNYVHKTRQMKLFQEAKKYLRSI